MHIATVNVNANLLLEIEGFSAVQLPTFEIDVVNS